MKKIIDSSILVAVLALFAVATAKAETVVWYTFDDLTPGDRLADGSTVENKAKPGTHDATVRGMTGMNKNPASSSMPSVTNGIPDSARVFDPVSGAIGSSEDSALYFPCGSASGQGAMLEIANDPELRMQSFTVEAFMRLKKVPSGGWISIANQVSASAEKNTSDYAWYFGMHDNVNVRNLVLLFTNETYGAGYTLSDGGVDFSDLKWHHVAFSVEPNASDPSHTDVKLYFDYLPRSSGTFNFPIECPTSADRPVQVGGDSIRNRLFQGDLSEFRISSGALTPAQFLRPRSSDSNIDKDCVLYYDFEDLTEDWSWFGAKFGDVVNKAMPGIMDGTIVTNTAKSNLAPGFVEDTPGPRIRQSLHDTTYRNSEKSLCNYVEDPRLEWNSTNYCGYLKCQPLDTAWFSKTNFTIETFFMSTNNVEKWAPLFQRKGGWNVQVQIGMSTAGGKIGYNITTNETIGQVEQQASSYTMGEWHHFAIVVDQTGESKRLTAYLDNIAVRSVDLHSGITQNNASNVSDHGGAWFIAGGPSGCSFDGKIDSMRVTLRALEPDEFLTAKGRTLAHVKFDDETVNADPEGGTMVAGVNAKASDAGAVATFSGDVPGAVIRDGKNGEVITKHNAKSLSLSGSKVTWGSPSDGYGDTYFIRRTLTGDKRTSWTVEFWMKTTLTQNTWSRIITASNAGDLGSGYAYALTFWGSNFLSLRGSNNDPTADSTVNVCDGKWHHIALTYAPNADYPDSKSDVKLYIDYGDEEGGHTYSRTTHLTSEPWNNKDPGGVGLVAYPDNLMFVLGMGSSSANTYNGLIDEFRISDGALEPEEFLRAENAPGFSIIIR